MAIPNTMFTTALIFTFFSLSAYSASKYTGPIIDVHVHAYKEQSPLFGLEHPPTLRGKTYRAVKNAEHLAYFGESDRSFRFYPITFSSSFSSLPVLP